MVIVFEKLQYYGIGPLAVHSINNFGDGTRVIGENCLQYYGIEYTPPGLKITANRPT